MLIPQRQSRLVEMLSQRGMSDLESLAKELSVSLSTIRRDLEQLEKSGLVARTHGGAVWHGAREGQSRPYAFDQRMNYLLEPKQKIAVAAAKLVKSGETILLDGGSTTYHLAKELVGQSLQIVTNSLPIADLFVNDDHVELILTGGLLYPRYAVLLGPVTEKTIAAMHVSTLFLSVAGISEGALYNQNLLLVDSERQMIEQTQRVVLLVDSSKFGQRALARLGSLDEIDVIVTDPGITDENRRELELAGCQVIVG
jgi:DeoR/GlpR family transcriptional regulator of sugar metabolism